MMGAGVISESDSSGEERAVAFWLLLVCGLVFAMVVLGGVTRLTHSGLSITEWRPVTGWLPPLDEASWQAAFDRYKAFPEYREINRGMSLSEFKGIFWLEYAHRLLGRLIGVIFLLPFLYFAARRRLRRGLLAKLGLIFVLGALQGLLGWYMVKSGLVDRPDVSQYRLAAHLGLAVVVYGFSLWTALGLLMRPAEAPARIRRLGWLLVGLIFMTILSGGFVAGLDAGFVYNTFPLMDGEWVTPDAFATRPLIRDVFENRASVQFEHRLLALVVTFVVMLYWFLASRAPLSALARGAAHAFAAGLVVQVALGVTTLVFVVPVALGAAHQAGAMVLFSLALFAARTMGHRRA